MSVSSTRWCGDSSSIQRVCILLKNFNCTGRKASSEAKWEVSWYSAEDAKRIDDFVFEHWVLKKRFGRIQLTPIQKGSISSRVCSRP